MTAILMARWRFAACGALVAVAILAGIRPVLAQDRVLIPWKTLAGGQVVTRLDSSGDPLLGEAQGYSAFVFPSALVVRGPDLYIADSGARKIYRFDPALQVLIAVPGMGATSRTRLQVGPDRTLFVLDAGSSAVLRFDRTGQLLETLADPQAEAALEEFVVDDHSGQIVAADRRSRRLVMIDPPGWVIRSLPATGAGEPASWGALAGSGHSRYAVDGTCSCVVALDEDGRVRDRIGKGDLVQPRALAADQHGRLFIADAFTHTLRIYRHGERVASYEARKLHVSEFSALAIDEGSLYVADGPGGQIAVFHIRPPRKTGKDDPSGAEDR
jgi:streptogramin lyase